jgi:hypothetical protein
MSASKNKTRTYVNTLIENPIATMGCTVFPGIELDHADFGRVSRASLRGHDLTLAAPGTPCPFF